MHLIFFQLQSLPPIQITGQGDVVSSNQYRFRIFVSQIDSLFKFLEKIPFFSQHKEFVKKIAERLNKGSLENIQLEIKRDPSSGIKINDIPVLELLLSKSNVFSVPIKHLEHFMAEA